MRMMRFLGPGDPDHLLSASRYYLRPGQLRRMLFRQLFVFSVPDVPEPQAGRFVPVPDVAAEVPTTMNGGIREDGTRYTIRLRGGVLWDADPVREVTAEDFVRGFERLRYLDPGADAAAYFADTIEAVQAIDPRTLDIRLHRPANDLLDILSLGFLVAVPEEQRDRPLESIPGARTVCNGPYRICHGDRRTLVLEPNPAWKPDTDPVRVRDAERIEVLAPESPEQASRDIAAGRIDLAWPFAVACWQAGQASFPDSFPGFTLNPYLVFNTRSAATSKPGVRRAVAHAVNKLAVDDIVRDLLGVATRPVHSVLLPGNLGHVEDGRCRFERSEPARARAALQDAGCPDGLVLTGVVRDIAFQRRIMESIAVDLVACGVRLDIRVVAPSEYYGKVLDPARAAAGEWDIALPGWTPDWFGNNGRAALRPLFGTGQAGNFGDYRNVEVDRLIEAALAAADAERAARYWRLVDDAVMTDLPVLPMLAFACECCAARTGSTGWGMVP
jgi:peptide/nickel transport system substrate-binding protein